MISTPGKSLRRNARSSFGRKRRISGSIFANKYSEKSGSDYLHTNAVFSIGAWNAHVFLGLRRARSTFYIFFVVPCIRNYGMKMLAHRDGKPEIKLVFFKLL